MQNETSDSGCSDLNPREWIGDRVDMRPITTNTVAIRSVSVTYVL